MPTPSNLAQNESCLPRSEPEVAVLSAPRHFTTLTTSASPVAPNDVLIEVEGCGVCASSLSIWEGRPWFDYPISPGAPGHEGWGRILTTGSNVKHLQVGQRVAFLGHSAFAKLSQTSAHQVVPLPSELDDMPFPGEAIGCAMNIYRRADIQAGQTVAIIGAGFLGLLLVQLAIDAGAEVFVLTRRESARKRALDYGATATLDTEDWWGNAHKVVEFTQGKGCDRVIEVTGMQFAVDAATEMVAEYGKLVIAGYHQDGLRQVNLQKWNWRAIDVINAHERDPSRYIQGIEDGIEATLSGRIRPQELLTHVFPLAQLDQAFQMMIDRPDGFIKGWVQP